MVPRSQKVYLYPLIVIRVVERPSSSSSGLSPHSLCSPSSCRPMLDAAVRAGVQPDELPVYTTHFTLSTPSSSMLRLRDGWPGSIDSAAILFAADRQSTGVPEPRVAGPYYSPLPP